MDHVLHSFRAALVALVAGLTLVAVAVLVGAGLPAASAGNGWHRPADAPTAGNGWHSKGAVVLAGNGWHRTADKGNGWH